mgnify:CR=1 FL=1
MSMNSNVKQISFNPCFSGSLSGTGIACGFKNLSYCNGVSILVFLDHCLERPLAV